MAERILVTGGAGFLGSHTAVELLDAGHSVVVADDLSNSSPESLRRVSQLTGKELAFHQLDISDEAALGALFEAEAIDAVIHFAGRKAVGESTLAPLDYYRCNLSSTLVLLETMKRCGVKKLIFSSSCNVYGASKQVPVREDVPLKAANPYGRTKVFIEEILRDVCSLEEGWHMISLRYFNPVGAHASGSIGEDPAGTPNNLMPYATQVAVGRREFVPVFGDDYPTPDGTGVRDYLHVVDLARGHLAALGKLEKNNAYRAYNLGTGHGSSVLEVIHTLREVSGREIPYRILERRPGDIAESWANADLAANELGWRARHSLREMCEDAWRWQSKHPDGYPG